MSTTLSGFTIAKPSTAPTATAGTVSGSLDTSAAYNYKVTFVTAYGETDPSSAGSVTTSSTGSVALTAIAVSSNDNVYARKIYRTAGGGSTYLLLATISDNTTTTYSDTVADASLTDAVTTYNSAHSTQTVNGLFKISKPALFSIERAITAGAGGTSVAAYQLASEYNWITTVTTTNDSVKLPAAATATIGKHIVIRNNHANTAKIYPFDGQTINGGSADAAITIATTVTTQLVQDTATNWQVI